MRITESMNNFTVDLVIEGFFTPDEELKIRQAVRHITLVVSSEEFKNYCLNFSYSQQVCTGKLWWRNCTTQVINNFNWNFTPTKRNKTNLEIYNHIISGKEVLNPVIDNTANIVLRIDRRRSRGVIGYTYPNTVTQWVYSWFLTSSYKEIAGNIFHEWCHKLGYDHAFRYAWDREFTVPYALGYYVARANAKI
jgi:hypothetical protein